MTTHLLLIVEVALVNIQNVGPFLVFFFVILSRVGYEIKVLQCLLDFFNFSFLFVILLIILILVLVSLPFAFLLLFYFDLLCCLLFFLFLCLDFFRCFLLAG